MQIKSVAIIGAGVSGLAAIKSCLEECLEPVCFEQFDNIGGTWRLTEQHMEGQGASVYNSMLMNTSKNMSCYSDYTFPTDAPLYTNSQGMHEYLTSYADNFKLWQYIRLNCEVINVCEAEDYDETGRWNVTYQQKGSKPVTYTYDAVMVCSGRQRIPKYPKLPGIESFEGETMHSIAYRSADRFKDKVVLIVGNGNSAGDIATDAAEVAKQVYFSSGDGFWIIPRTDGKTIPPFDLVSRIFFFLPTMLLNYIFTKKLNKNINHREKNIVTSTNRGPAHSILIINGTVIEKINSGDIIIKHHIERFTKQGVVFMDGTKIDDVDVIVFATGYELECKFLSKDILPATWDKISLYRLILPTNLKHSTLFMIGCTQIRGAVVIPYETQSRWSVAMMVGRIKRPSIYVMLKSVADRNKLFVNLYGYLKVWVLGVPYADELAADLGLVPPFWKTLFTHPIELLQFYIRPAFPMTLRLYGCHAWSGARTAIEGAQWRSQVMEADT